MEVAANRRHVCNSHARSEENVAAVGASIKHKVLLTEELKLTNNGAGRIRKLRGFILKIILATKILLQLLEI